MSDSRDPRSLRELAALTEGLRPDDALSDEVLLAAAAEATRDLDTGSGFDSALMDAVQLEHLARRTEGLGPHARLTDEVMARIAADAEAPRSSAPWPGLLRSGRAALVAAAAIAATTVLYAGYVETTFDSDVIANVDAIEVGE
jgi:hypothetical protein